MYTIWLDYWLPMSGVRIGHLREESTHIEVPQCKQAGRAKCYQVGRRINICCLIKAIGSSSYIGNGRCHRAYVTATGPGRLPLTFMTILGIGVDIVHLPRIFNLLDRHRFARRILSDTEILRWNVLPNNKTKRAQFLAVRYVPHIFNTDTG